MIFLWVALYGLTYILSESISVSAGMDWLSPILLALYAAFLITWLLFTGRHRSIGLCAMRSPRAFEWLEFLPLLIIPSANLVSAPLPAADFHTFLLVLSVCTVEEIFFRGFILRFFTKYGTICAVLVSSLIFALFHFVNLINGQDFTYTLAQVLCAFILGISYGVIAIRYGSILPIIAAHFLTNITGAKASHITALLWICIAVCGCFDILLCLRIRQDRHLQ